MRREKLAMDKRTKKNFMLYVAMVMMLTLGTTTAFAADDPLAVVNNLSEFIFGLIRAIGMILLGFGIVQIGLSLKSHDPSQRANGFLTLAGGVIITFALFASSPPEVDSSAAAVTMVWTYVGELIFNMLVLVGAVKMSDRVVREMMGL